MLARNPETYPGRRRARDILHRNTHLFMCVFVVFTASAKQEAPLLWSSPFCFPAASEYPGLHTRLSGEKLLCVLIQAVKNGHPFGKQCPNGRACLNVPAHIQTKIRTSAKTAYELNKLGTITFLDIIAKQLLERGMQIKLALILNCSSISANFAKRFLHTQHQAFA